MRPWKALGRTGWWLSTMTAIVALAGFGAFANPALAQEGGDDGPAVITNSGVRFGAQRHRKVSETSARITTSQAYITLVATTITVPSGTSLINTSFSGESACYGGGGGANWCTVRILIGGVEANPVVGTDFAFDSTDLGDDTFASWESHAMDRWRLFSCGASSCTVSVVAQWRAVGAAGTTFRLDDWTLGITVYD